MGATMDQQDYDEYEGEGDGPSYSRNSYEGEGGTAMLATNCLICGRPLRDPDSLERGVGPVCAQKHEMFSMAGGQNPTSIEHTLETAPPLVRQVVEPKLGDPRSALSAAIHLAGRAWETRASDALAYIGATMEIAHGLGYPGTARALERVFIRGEKFDESGNRVGSGRPPGIVVSDKGDGRWMISLPFIQNKDVWRQVQARLKAAGVRNQNMGGNVWELTFPGNETAWAKSLNALVSSLPGTLGVLPTGEVFLVPQEPVPVPEDAPAPEGASGTKATSEKPGELAEDTAELKSGSTVFWKGKPMVIAWVSPDQVRCILLTPEAAERSMREIGELHGKRYGGVSAGMRDVATTAPTAAEKKDVAAAIDTEVLRQDVVHLELPERLMQHQREGVLWLRQQRSGLLAFDMGLGKTAIALLALDTPAVVFCPKGLKSNWIHETAMWRPDLTASKVDADSERKGNLDALLAADLVVLNYDLADRYQEKLAARGFKTLIADESHYLKTFRLSWKRGERGSWSPKLAGSKRAQAVWHVARDIERRLLLSGTPMDNKSPCEMFGQLHMVAPREFNNFYRYGDQYCDPQEFMVRGRKVKTYDGATNTLELHERINGKYMLRRTKDVLDLPEKWRQTKLISLDAETAKHYERAAKDLLRYIEEEGGWEAMDRASRARVLVEMQTLRRLCGIGKVEAFVEEVVEHWHSTGRPLIIFAFHKDVQQQLLKTLQELTEPVRSKKGEESAPVLKASVGAMLADMNETERERQKMKFQEGELMPDGSREFTDIIVLSYAFKEGITLTRSQETFFIERTWSPHHLDQAESRNHRIGQKNQVTVTYYDAAGTFDQKIGQMLTAKLGTAKAVIEGVEAEEQDLMEGIFGKQKKGPGYKANQAASLAELMPFTEPD
jgi:SWI/SNF-related matrix-associated actin-dependent regulator 1 of chromatin subfamily A